MHLRPRLVALTGGLALVALVAVDCTQESSRAADGTIAVPAASAYVTTGVRDSAGGQITTPAAAAAAAPVQSPTAPACDPGNGGITLPTGFCATVFADSIGAARHVTVAPNGDVFVALQRAARRDTTGAPARGGIVALRDANGDGHADVREYFGDLGGTGIALAGGYLYADAKTAIVRYRIPAGQLRPSGPPDTIVAGLPTTGHGAHPFVLDGRGALFVNVGSATNACQQKDRAEGSPGVDPCVELQTRAGIWRYDADVVGQRFSPAERHATGLRNAMAMALDPRGGALYAAVHGRDQLSANWPQRFTTAQNAEKPSEVLVRIERGGDYGWPYCYHDPELKRMILAPEYGGDGRDVGRCSAARPPVVAFPAHWAPMATLFYTGRAFPAKYRSGAFVSFHGSWNRAPLPQEGFRVAFTPMANGAFSGSYETFASGFRGAGTAARAIHRPVGLAQGPDGALYLTDDAGGRVWRVVWRGS
jgi:glucose/arabinose dehydrogenase